MGGRGWALGCAGFLLATLPALAASYEVDPSFLTEQELYELAARGDLSEESLQTLLWLLRHPIDPSSASPDQLYALPDLSWQDVQATLDGARNPAGGPGWNASVVLQARTAFQDPATPTAWLQASARMGQWSVGLLAAETRQKLNDLRYSEEERALSAPAAAPQFEIPKLYLEWSAPGVHLLLGSFTAGFGQRVTFDTSPLPQPNGFYADDGVRSPTRAQSSECRLSSCTQEELRLRTTPDVRWSVPFRGAAISVSGPKFHTAASSLAVMASYQALPAYQYQLFNSDACSDPRSSSPACAAPPIYLRTNSGTLTSSAHQFRTVQGAVDEAVLAGHLQLDAPRSSVGATGYWASTVSRIHGMRLGFQEYARVPFGGPYGAVGVNASTVAGPFRFLAELTRSFDREPGNGGGLAALQRSVYTLRGAELDLSFRYYGPTFLNRFAGSLAASDLDSGQRARNEWGTHLRFFQRGAWGFRLRSDLEVWLPVQGPVHSPALRASARLDSLHSSVFQPSLFGAFQSLRSCPDVPSEDAHPCERRSAVLGVQVRLAFPNNRGELLFQGRAKSLSDQLNASLYGQLQVWASSWLGLRFRSAYLDESIRQPERGETSLWSLAELTWRPRSRWQAQLRYDHFLFLDQRPSSGTRAQNPEHRFWLELEASL